jgi:hypothetical protein
MVRGVTGWQGNEGGQGGWNQPPNGPQGGDPYQHPYNPDPYGYNGPQGTAPYPYNPSESGNPYQTGGFPAQGYGTDPYGQQQQDPYGQNPYGQSPYGQDQYGQYNPYQTGGFGEPDFSPAPKRSKAPMIFGVLAIVIIVGAVIAIVLVNRNGDDKNAGPAGQSSEQPAPKSGEKSTPPSSGGPSEPGGKDGWQTIDNTADSGLTYQVPPDWKKSDSARPSGLDVDFTGTAEYGVYECQGAGYARSFATSGDVQAKGGGDLDLNKTVTDFAKSFGKSYFKDTATVDAGSPEEVEVDGKKAVKVTAPVTPKVSIPKCEAAKGEVAIIGVLIEDQGKPSGVAMLAVVSDVEGGPADPKPLPTDVAQDILSSARVG